MTVKREFKNRLGIVQLQWYEDENLYAVWWDAREHAYIGGFETYRYWQDAMKMYQFQVYWLKDNEKNV